MTSRALVLPILLPVAAVAAFALAGCGSDEAAPAPDVNDPVYIYAGNGQAGFGSMGHAPRKTRLYWPQDVTFMPDGKPMVIDWNNHRVIAQDADGNFALIAGSADNDFGDPCPLPPAACVDVLATAAKLNHPTHVCFDGNGNMVLCAWHNSELFLLDMTTGLMDRFCGTGFRPCFGPDQNDPQNAIDACVDLPSAVGFDAQGGLCFTDQANMIIRRVNMETGIVETVAGTQPTLNPAYPTTSQQKWILHFGFTGDGGPATLAQLSFERGQIADPSGKICFDNLGNMYIADTMNHAVRKVDTDGIITRVAGAAPVDDGTGNMVGTRGYSGDGGPATSATLFKPRDVAIDTDGTLFIADTGNNVIRMVRPDGIISTLVGVHRPDKPTALQPDVLLLEDGAGATSVHLTEPSGVAVAPGGRLYIADTGNNVIRVFDR